MIARSWCGWSKGAYWDTEIKLAQELGVERFPVFTRKNNTDVSYMACAQMLMDRRDRIYPQFATHNAHTCAAVVAMAGNDKDSFEFQRLHGMGESLHEIVKAVRGHALPDLCAGRRASGSAGLSRPPTAGKRGQFVLREPDRRSRYPGRSDLCRSGHGDGETGRPDRQPDDPATGRPVRAVAPEFQGLPDQRTRLDPAASGRARGLCRHDMVSRPR